MKFVFMMLLSLLLFTNCLALSSHQVLPSHGVAHGHEKRFGFHAMPRKLMLNEKASSQTLVEVFNQDKDLVSNNEVLSGESHKAGVKEATASSSKVTKKEAIDPFRVFARDYSPARKRRPVHNKSFPTTANTP
ncbi:hypothetical protein Tco_0236090 [Tanacetum coccineum]